MSAVAPSPAYPHNADGFCSSPDMFEEYRHALKWGIPPHGVSALNSHPRPGRQGRPIRVIQGHPRLHTVWLHRGGRPRAHPMQEAVEVVSEGINRRLLPSSTVTCNARPAGRACRGGGLPATSLPPPPSPPSPFFHCRRSQPPKLERSPLRGRAWTLFPAVQVQNRVPTGGAEELKLGRCEAL